MIALSGISTKSSAQERRQQQKQYQPPAPPPSEPVMPGIIVSPEEDYRIGPADVIEILIEDAPELSRTLRVSADGAIVLPFVGRIIAHQRTVQELSGMIADRLRGQYLENPQVSVTVKQVNSRSFFVQGAVRRPGLYQIEGKPSLLKLITIAGGLNENYGSTAFIIREIKTGVLNREVGEGRTESIKQNSTSENEQEPSTNSLPPADTNPQAADEAKYELIKANINGLLRGNFDQNITIEPGDIIHIPPTEVFFVAGEVNAPGSFALKEGTTLRQAISLAQGTTFQAAASNSIIFREDPATGKRQEIKVDLSSVMSGKKEDQLILANDIVIVPNSRLKSIGGTLLRAFGINSARLPYRSGY